jgi:hypothetical protein
VLGHPDFVPVAVYPEFGLDPSQISLAGVYRANRFGGAVKLHWLDGQARIFTDSPYFVYQSVTK